MHNARMQIQQHEFYDKTVVSVMTNSFNIWYTIHCQPINRICFFVRYFTYRIFTDAHIP